MDPPVHDSSNTTRQHERGDRSLAVQIFVDGGGEQRGHAAGGGDDEGIGGAGVGEVDWAGDVDYGVHGVHGGVKGGGDGHVRDEDVLELVVVGDAVAVAVAVAIVAAIATRSRGFVGSKSRLRSHSLQCICMPRCAADSIVEAQQEVGDVRGYVAVDARDEDDFGPVGRVGLGVVR